MSKRTLRPVTQRRVYKSTAIQLSEIALHADTSPQDMLEPLVARLHQVIEGYPPAGETRTLKQRIADLIKRMVEVK